MSQPKKIDLDELNLEDFGICVDACCYCYLLNPFVKKGERPCEFYPEKMPINSDIMSVFGCEHHQKINVELTQISLKNPLEESIEGLINEVFKIEEFKKFRKGDRKNRKKVEMKITCDNCHKSFRTYVFTKKLCPKCKKKFKKKK